jgi:hypothetical protein
MANLIIKSSANDLVIQGSDNSPAITVAAAGTTTFAENATLSGTGNSISSLGTVTSGTLNSTVVTSGWDKIEIFPHSVDDVGTLSVSSYCGRFSFTPTFGCNLLVGWGFSFRHSATSHCYCAPRLLNASNATLETARTHGANHPAGTSSWNNGSGGLEYFTTSLTGGTGYQLELSIEAGASIGRANDLGHDFKMTAICYS